MNAIQAREVTAAIAQLRAEIEQLPQDRGGKRKGISAELKQQAAAVLSSSGMRLDEFAQAICVSESAMSCWRRQFGAELKNGKSVVNREAPVFKALSITPDKSAPQSRGITIEGPNGIKITGLSAPEVAQLWRSLC